MNKTNIEWVKNPDGSQGYTWNPITGCLNHVNGLCKGGGFPCYAYKLANTRLEQRYLANMHIVEPRLKEQSDYDEALHEQETEMEIALDDPFYPRFWEERLMDLRPNVIAGQEKGIFVCDMGDLFGIGVPEEWTRRILSHIKAWPEHRFYLLTKQSQNLIKFSPFPDNVWLGVTATSNLPFIGASISLAKIEASIKYISLEPYLSPVSRQSLGLMAKAGISWLIIGACTSSASDIGKVQRRYPDLEHKPLGNKWTAQPRIEWVREIVEAADKVGVKVFLKDNLRPLLIPEDCSKPNSLMDDIFWASEKAQLRQEMSDVVAITKEGK